VNICSDVPVFHPLHGHITVTDFPAFYLLEGMHYFFRYKQLKG
jgi:hypothetical protein